MSAEVSLHKRSADTRKRIQNYAGAGQVPF